jgi:transposase
MARPKTLLTESDIQQLKSITRGDNTAATGHRLAAVRAYINHSATDVASFFGITAETVLRWVSKYHAEGIDGLSNHLRGHRKMKLNEEKAAAVRYWLNNDCNSNGEYVHWTLQRLSLEIKQVYDLDISVAALGSTLKKMGIALKRPRPMHYNSSPEKREEFKKKSARHSRKAKRNA